jgi:hypothetical protein
MALLRCRKNLRTEVEESDWSFFFVVFVALSNKLLQLL